MNFMVHIRGIMRMLDMFDIMRDVGTEIGGITGSSETCRKKSTEIKALSQFWTGLLINLIERLG